MLSSTLRLLRGQPSRIGLTVSGIALSVLLMGFLLALYRGVETGSVAYLRSTHPDVWVLQVHTTNVLRGLSVLTEAHGNLIREVEGVESVSPILFRLSSVPTMKGPATVFLAGYDPTAAAGRPPRMVAGRSIERSGEIVFDEAFARKWGIALGNGVLIQDVPVRVVGLSGGTNMLVIQYAFASLDDVRRMYGFSDIVSVYAVRGRPGTDRTRLRTTLQDEIPGTSVYLHEEFVTSNVREMESGFLPVLLVLALVGTLALGAIVSLLLTLDILERRTDLAVLKTIGAPVYFLPATVMMQSLFLSGISFLIAAGMAWPVAALVRWAAPEVAPMLNLSDVVMLAAGLLAVSGASTIVPLRRLRTIYPTEAFA